MLIGIFYSQIVESSSLVSVLFREAISHPYISFFYLLVNGFSVTSFRTSLKTPYLYLLVERGGIKMVSAKNYQIISSQGPHFSPRSTAKTNDKSTNLRKNGIYWYKCIAPKWPASGGSGPHFPTNTRWPAMSLQKPAFHSMSK